MEVDPGIGSSALFQFIKKKLGHDGEMELKQYDRDINQWVEGEIEPMDGAEFQVIKKVMEGAL